MSTTIMYCDKCARLIPPSQRQSAAANESVTLCAECLAGLSEQERRAYDAFNRKYGLIMRVGTLFSTLVGRVRKRLVLEVTLDGNA